MTSATSVSLWQKTRTANIHKERIKIIVRKFCVVIVGSLDFKRPPEVVHKAFIIDFQNIQKNDASRRFSQTYLEFVTQVRNLLLLVLIVLSHQTRIPKLRTTKFVLGDQERF